VPRLLDLFCGAGGAALGYHRAGFTVVGVDHVPRNFPFKLVKADALEYLLDMELGNYDAIHASPPCQFASALANQYKYKRNSPNHIPLLRDLLERTGLPYVIENVPGAADWLIRPVTICGSMFEPPLKLRRHRLFETNWPLTVSLHCRHLLPNWETVDVGNFKVPLQDQLEAMGTPWMNKREVCEAIPPAYTTLIGMQLRNYLSTEPSRTVLS
jgi:DNA (cytosine-5)-methyltransferase 1